MKILILSDSHAHLSFMRWCILAVKPDAVVHLGDYYDDGTAIAEEFGISRFYQVPGNCDKYRMVSLVPERLAQKVCGVMLFMTHGHHYPVKYQSYSAMIGDGRKAGAQAVCFGHTHEAYCLQEEDGLWVVNPGSCGTYGGSCAVIEAENNQIIGCRILRQPELDALTEAEEKQGQ